MPYEKLSRFINIADSMAEVQMQRRISVNWAPHQISAKLRYPVIKFDVIKAVGIVCECFSFPPSNYVVLENAVRLGTTNN